MQISVGSERRERMQKYPQGVLPQGNILPSGCNQSFLGFE